MTAFHLDGALGPLARRQHGVFAWFQVRQLGFSDTVVAARVASGRWIRLAREVYALAGSEGTFLRQCWASVLVSPHGAVGGLAAAAVSSFTDFRACRPEVVLPPGIAWRNPFATVRRY